MKIKYLDTFAWVGGFHLALEQSIWKENVECVWFSEIDKFAKQVYNNRFPNSYDFWDISKLDIVWLPDFDLLTWWFPCQDVSVAWKQNLKGGGRTVLVEYLLQILEEKQPKYFIFENVKGLMGKKFDVFRESIFERITNAWYLFDYKVLNTKDFWLPQNRERVFIVWTLNITTVPNWKWDFQFPKWEQLTTFLRDILEEEVTENFYMTTEQYNKLNYDSLKRIYDKIAPTLDTMQWWHRQPKIITNVNPSWKWMNWNVYRTDTESPTLTTNKWEWIKIIERWHWFFKWSVGDRDVLNTVRSNIQWNTLVEESKTRIRKITPIECARLQWFPDTWSTEFVSNSQAYKQMWNAVSVPVVKNIFDNLLLWNFYTA